MQGVSFLQYIEKELRKMVLKVGRFELIINPSVMLAALAVAVAYSGIDVPLFK